MLPPRTVQLLRTSAIEWQQKARSKKQRAQQQIKLATSRSIA